jgi:hypothetical protein
MESDYFKFIDLVFYVGILFIIGAITCCIMSHFKPNKVLVKSSYHKPQVCSAKMSDGFLNFKFKGNDYAVKPDDVDFTFCDRQLLLLFPRWLPTADLSKIGE